MRVPFLPILHLDILSCKMMHIVKVNTQIFKCTGLMPSDINCVNFEVPLATNVGKYKR